MIRILTLALFLAAPAWADVGPEKVEDLGGGCTKYTMCDAEADTGDCMRDAGAGDDEIVLKLGSRSNLTFYGSQSSGTVSCDVVSNDQGHDAAGGVGFTLNSTSITDNANTPILSLSGLFDYIWITCPTIGTTAHVTALVCPADR